MSSILPESWIGESRSSPLLPMVLEASRFPASIEEMAAVRLPAILAAQPTGPYRLAGHCVGGIVALETARLLMKPNYRVETVVMIDFPSVMVNGEALKRPALGAADRG